LYGLGQGGVHVWISGGGGRCWCPTCRGNNAGQDQA
jgi:hypothetical protein